MEIKKIEGIPKDIIRYWIKNKYSESMILEQLKEVGKTISEDDLQYIMSLVGENTQEKVYSQPVKKREKENNFKLRLKVSDRVKRENKKQKKKKMDEISKELDKGKVILEDQISFDYTIMKMALNSGYTLKDIIDIAKKKKIEIPKKDLEKVLDEI